MSELKHIKVKTVPIQVEFKKKDGGSIKVKGYRSIKVSMKDKIEKRKTYHITKNY